MRIPFLSLIWLLLSWLLLIWSTTMAFPANPIGAQDRPRLRELGRSPGVLSPGPTNAITDVPGVAVGHCTVCPGSKVRTGVTAILPHQRNLYQEKVTAAVSVGNAFGKAAGFLQIRELGTLETPIVLTNTLSVGTAIEATVSWTLRQIGNEDVGSVNAVVGETNDGYLNDIRGQHVTPQHVWAAIESAKGGAVEEGAVGAGTGTVAFGYKGGIGTSSRRAPTGQGDYTVGVLVQSNFGGVLTIDGVPVDKEWGRIPFQTKSEAEPESSDDGSCMIVLATDAPIDARQLERLVNRTFFGMARTGSIMSHGSGDFAIGFSTDSLSKKISDQELTPLFLAAVEATEEAIINSLLKATDQRGHKKREIKAIPIQDLKRLFEQYR